MRCLKWDCYLVSLRSHSSSGPDTPFASGDVCATAVTITMTGTQDATPPAMRLGGSRRISPSCRSFCGSRSSSIAPRLPSHRMWFRRGLVLQIGSTGPATPPHGVLALLQRYEPAICGTVFIIALGAPRIVSRLGGFFDANNSCRRAQDD